MTRRNQTQPIPVKEEEIIRQIVVKKGDTLHHIIVQTYGAYDDVTLNEVQQTKS